MIRRSTTLALITSVLMMGILPSVVSREYMGLECAIKGRVVDKDTGDPIENVTIYVRNLTFDLYFSAVTDKNGEYEIQVGRPGSYTVLPLADLYHEVSRKISVESRLEFVETDFRLERYETNVYGIAHSDYHWPLSNYTFGIIDEDNPNLVHFVTTDENGEFETTLPPGNYTAVMEENDLFPRTTHDFTVREDKRTYLSMEHDFSLNREFPRHVFNEDDVLVPPGNQVLFVFESEMASWMVLSFQNTGRMDVMELTWGMYVQHHNGTVQGESLNVWDPGISFDTCLQNATGGGGDVQVWRSPYCILIRNWGEEEQVCHFSLKYDYGNFTKVGYINRTIPDLAEEKAEVETDDEIQIDLLAILPLILLIAASIYLIVTHSRGMSNIR